MQSLNQPLSATPPDGKCSREEFLPLIPKLCTKHGVIQQRSKSWKTDREKSLQNTGKSRRENPNLEIAIPIFGFFSESTAK